jgi:cytochrome c
VIPRRLLLPALLLAAALPAAAAEADDGRAVFDARCASCHAVAAGAPPGAGPNLAGVVGRRVGGDPGFDYSPVREEARQEGRVWDTALLERFLADPEEMFPGLWMGNNGLRAVGDRAAVAAFLRTTK